jgi:hypothetical protein
MNADELEARKIAPDWMRRYGAHSLWSEIMPGLSQGGTADEDVLGVMARHNSVHYGTAVDPVDTAPYLTSEMFDAVVTLYVCARPVGNGIEEYRWHIFDDPDVPFECETESMQDVVRWAHRRWQAGKRVLIRCQAGLNRSGLVAALVLVRSGLTPQEAIDKLRRQRSNRVLFNKEFERYVLETPVETWRS